MYSDWVLVVVGGMILWLGILTYLIWKQGNFLKELFPKSGERDIRKKFEEVVEIVGRLEKLENESLKHIQRVELLRYNPYDDTGGEISFSVALLDEEGSGLVLTSLHARSGTRTFAKPVRDGMPTKFQFSKEEEEVIKKALS